MLFENVLVLQGAFLLVRQGNGLVREKKHNLALEDKDDKIVVLLTSPMAKKVKAEHLQSLCMMCSSLPKQCPRVGLLYLGPVMLC